MAPCSELEHKAREAFMDDDFALAVALYTQAIAAGLPTAALYADRAQAYIKIGDFVAAATDAARAVELDPAMARAHLRKAHACVKLEQYDAARAAVEAGAALAPRDARFAKLMKEIDGNAPKPMETEARPAVAVAAPVPVTAGTMSAAAAEDLAAPAAAEDMADPAVAEGMIVAAKDMAAVAAVTEPPN